MKDLQSSHRGEELQDIGNGLLSLLQIMAADGHLHETEQQRVREYGRECGFAVNYVEEIIAASLTNKHLPKAPPKFNSSTTAREFLRSAAELALCDGHLHHREQSWLSSFADINGLGDS